MSDVYAVKEKLHKLRALLYPSYLPGTEGTYIARTVNEVILHTEDIVASMKNRSGFEGNTDEAVRIIRHYNKELLYLLCDGYTTNCDYYAVHAHIGGTFASARERFDPKKHPLSFRFQALKLMNDILHNDVEVEIEGVADVNGYIDEYTDEDGKQTNAVFVSGGMFTIRGHKIKLEGDDPAVGLFFIPDGDPSKAVKAVRIAENFGTKITGVAPAVLGGKVKVEIRTQFSGSGPHILKSPRVITSGFELTQY